MQSSRHLVPVVIFMFVVPGITGKPAHAQNRLRLPANHRPALSPYLDLFSSGQTLSQNYHQIVRPRQQQLRREQKQQIFNTRIWQSVNKNPRSTFQPAGKIASETSGATGVRSTFFNLSHFFPGRASDGTSP